jgi:thiamine phosphate synthase YjbQ (UPF0047 family)
MALRLPGPDTGECRHRDMIPAMKHLTPQVEARVRKSGVREGLLLANAMHITASVFINHNESGLHHDYEQWLERLAPTPPLASTATTTPARTTPMRI